VTTQAAATALLQAALRRRLVTVKEALALRHVLAGCGADPQAVRARLAHLPGQVSPETATALMALLPPAGEPGLAVAGLCQPLAQLGVGALGSTWLGLGQTGLVVLKRFDRAMLDDQGARQLGEDLAPLLGSGHRYLVNHLALRQAEDGAWTLVQHYRQGRDAWQRADIKGEASETRALTLLRHAAKGLAQIHHLDRSHGHLHPGNVLLDADGRAALGDHALAAGPAGIRWSARQLHREAWAAPEELGDRPVTGPAADIYALGCLGYWLLTGEPPFPGTPERQALQHLGADRPDVRTLAPGISELTAKTLLKCLQREPAERYDSARALVHSLERNLDLLDHPQGDTEPVNKPRMGNHGGVSPLLLQGLGNDEGEAP
jgi:serine/threonine protein kinase